MDLIEQLLTSESPDATHNEKLFGNRELIKEAIEKECQLMAGSQGQKAVILPMLNDSLKSELLERIAKKTLTEFHVAVAPSVSFE